MGMSHKIFHAKLCSAKTGSHFLIKISLNSIRKKFLPEFTEKKIKVDRNTIKN